MKIRFASDILRRLGEELNPSPDKGILELVKNAYDADALTCTVVVEGADEPGGSLVVADDGDGLTPEEIETGWLILGRSSKRQSTRTRLGRIPAGSKGLGRLAALRMGERALLTTNPRSERATEYNLLIDWSDYRDVELVDDVELELESAHRARGQKPGTKVTLEGLRTKITRGDLKRLAREMILLAGPFGDDRTGFNPVLRAPEFEDLERLVRDKYYDSADFHLTAEVNAGGQASARVVDQRGGVLFAATHNDLRSKPRGAIYSCPALKFEFWTFLLGKGTFAAHAVPRSQLRPWLDQFGGVHIYQNGLRVTPYGDRGNDWLDLNLSRVRSPEERPSTNNSIGRVVFDEAGLLLQQKTDRSGFIETEAFHEIREFCRDALDWMAGRRLEEAESRRSLRKVETKRQTDQSKKQLDAAIGKLPKQSRQSVGRAVEHAWGAVSKQLDQYEQDIQLYRTLSTVGITAATFAHESAGNPIKVIRNSAVTIQRRARKHVPQAYAEQLEKPVSAVLRAVDSLSVLGDATLRLLNHEKRRLSRVEIHATIRTVLDTFRPFLDAREIAVELRFCEGEPFFRASEAAVESIVTNFLNNSVAAFECTAGRARRITISTAVDGGSLVLRISDNGPGIEGIAIREIWLPGKTTRKNGTGLGLTIVKDTVKDLGGEVRCVEHGEFGGAEFLVHLPILGV